MHATIALTAPAWHLAAVPKALPPQKSEDTPPETCTLHQNRRDSMFEINGFDTAGVVKLKRLSLAAALKKAKELVEDGCWDVRVVDPGGHVYTSFEEQAA
ncbi:hypothetical protein GCM10007858_44700 [Bradyrhizobium liaoningense]|nr:hypothetical protein GCM10007858_44700 [Bradyrhizobium liaoningense]